MSGCKMQDVVFLVFFSCRIISHQMKKVAVINDRHTYEASRERYLDRYKKLGVSKKIFLKIWVSK